MENLKLELKTELKAEIKVKNNECISYNIKDLNKKELLSIQKTGTINLLELQKTHMQNKKELFKSIKKLNRFNNMSRIKGMMQEGKNLRSSLIHELNFLKYANTNMEV